MPVSPSDLRGAVRLATDATVGVACVAEGVHQAVWRTLGVPGLAPGRTGGLTGRVYASVRAIARLAGRSLEAGLNWWPGPAPDALEREAWRAVLNGVLGDRLAATDNPLALPMTLRHGGRALVAKAARHDTTPLSVPEATGRVLLLVHGLCMDDSAWGLRRDDALTHQEALAGLGYTPVTVRYNTGRPIAENGRLLAALLNRLVARWPVPVEEIAVVGHSMGGLVARSMVHHADQDGAAWRPALSRVVFLGTPHRGAPLEQMGRWVDAALTWTPYSAPFASLGAVRSAGITDLRHGHVTMCGTPVPLPLDVACYAIAATLAERRTALAEHLVGDGLVPLRSALDAPSVLDTPSEPRRPASFPAENHVILPSTGHVSLLRSRAVTEHLVRWLGSARARTGRRALPSGDAS